MDERSLIRQSFGAAAGRYEDSARLQRKVRRMATELARRYWSVGARVLDVGAGPGEFSVEARTRGWAVFSTDLAPPMCAVARSRGGRAVVADAGQLPFADGAFDGVFSSLMLQWVTDPAATLSEARRVVVPGGFCVVATLAEGTLGELSAALTGAGEAARPRRFLSAGQVAASARSAGLEVEAMREEAIAEPFDGAVAVMRSMKNIGALRAEERRGPRGLMTPRRLGRIEAAYPRVAGGGVVATWRVVLLAGRRPIAKPEGLR